MRTSKNQPRKEPARRRSSKGSPPAGGGSGSLLGRTVGDLMRGLSSQMNLGDLAKWAADRAVRTATRAARASGKSPKQSRAAARHARADAIRSVADKAGVSTATARRWARGGTPGAKSSASRSKVQRSLGGARAVRSDRISSTSAVTMGKVRVLIKSGPEAGRVEERNFGHLQPDRLTMEHVAELVAEGYDADAEALLGDALLDAYGAESGQQMSDFMEIVEIIDPTTWS